MIKAVTTGPLEENCYLVQLEPGGRLFVIDPGDSPADILAAAAQIKFSEAEILFTHGHFDHIGAAAAVAGKLAVSHCYLNTADRELFFSPDNCFPPYIPAPASLPPPEKVTDEIDFSEPAVIPTPGHTPGGVAFYFPALSALFSGDTLFASSIGRTDFPGGSLPDLLNSIKTGLFVLPPETKVFPGHGPTTTIDREKRTNPYV
ncbi:MAG: MBL fold metallo-hydrolase [Victivallaceae bacterium]|nr:MBL fold metallo-hydrolase [Victivallaceae bacterium]